jgi:uncharacterized coiled-coil DUF342 family protein
MDRKEDLAISRELAELSNRLYSTSQVIKNLSSASDNFSRKIRELWQEVDHIRERLRAVCLSQKAQEYRKRSSLH